MIADITPDTSSFPAFLRSLNITTPVTTRPGRMVSGPPAPLFELALRLGLGPLILDTPRNRSLLENVGVNPVLLRAFARRMRSRAMWRPLWEEFAAPHIAAADAAMANGDRERVIEESRAALALIGMAYGGDGYYVHTPMRENRKARQWTERLHAGLRAATGARVERISVAHPRGATAGLLHFPPNHAGGRAPALLAIHPLAWDKDAFDHALAPFREAGYATFSIDMPAHGDNFDGPRLQSDDEIVAVAALDALAAHPEIDSHRLGVVGGSLGAFFALRTAAASSHVKACAAFASPFDIGASLHLSVPGIQDEFAWVLGAPTLPEVYRLAKPFHLRGAAEKIRCPVILVHGTEDHICDFSATYEIARRVTAPLTVHPLVGVDHDAASPSAPRIAAPGVEWLKKNL
jgi:dipeptidyl aminopeptidase/acylaminoacyl peptidase